MEQLAKNQLHTAEITGYTSDGAGVCHIAGRAVFVKGALAGETWQVRILKVTANAVYGKAEQCLSPVPARTQPPCPVYRTCGGCSLQHMDYDEQLRMKLQRVNDALTRIGGVSMPVQDIIGMEYPLCYRNKAIYAVGTKDGRVVKGFYRASSHDITPVEQCLLQLPLADKAAQAVCDWMDLRGVAPYDEATGRGTVRHLFTRCAMHTPDAVLCIVSARGFGAQTDGLIAYLREHCPELTGIVLDVNKQKGNVVLAGDFYPLWGVPELTDRLCGLTFTLSPQAFYQVNPVQAERLYERAVEYAVNAPTDQVLDLYCGAGTISLCLARKAAHVIGAEIVPEAIENARRNAERNGIENAEFLCADAGAAAAELARRGVRPDCIVVDPPRKGMSPEAIDAMVSMQPPRIVYVSCDPGTLARDVKQLTQHGYTLTQALAVDMFPQTPHVETVVLLSKGEVDSKKIRVEFSLEDMDMSEFQDGATYPQIKEYVLEHTGLKVSNLYISQIKRKCGIGVGKNYNLPKSEDSRQPQCPPEKEKAIREAFKYFVDCISRFSKSSALRIVDSSPATYLSREITAAPKAPIIPLMSGRTASLVEIFSKALKTASL